VDEMTIGQILQLRAESLEINSPYGVASKTGGGMQESSIEG
jgi:hypothetical protein